MKNIHKIIASTCLILSVPVVCAKDKLINLDFEPVLQRGYDEGILDKNMIFKLSGQPHNPIIKNFKEFKTNKKTNGFAKSDTKSCDWVLLSALKALQNHAQSIGANAIIDIKSNFKNREFVSSTEYQCGAGFLMSGVALKANIVTLE